MCPCAFEISLGLTHSRVTPIKSQQHELNSATITANDCSLVGQQSIQRVIWFPDRLLRSMKFIVRWLPFEVRLGEEKKHFKTICPELLADPARSISSTNIPASTFSTFNSNRIPNIGFASVLNRECSLHKTKTAQYLRPYYNIREVVKKRIF